MIRLGQFLLQSRLYAGLVALACGLLLALGAALLAWFGLVLIALVTLRLGVKEGAIVLAWYLLPEIAIIFIKQVPWYLAYDVVMAVVLWLMAASLRQTRDWGQVLKLAMLIGIGAVVLVHVMIPDVAMWWQTQLTQLFSHEDYSQSIAALSQSATGSIAASSLAILLFMVFLARWWQAALFNKGGLKEEFFALRLSPWLTTALAIVALGLALDYPLFNDLLPVVLLPFIIKGLMLCHYLAAVHKSHKVIMIAIYTIMLIFSPYSVIMLALFGVVDYWLDFRKKVTQVS